MFAQIKKIANHYLEKFSFGYPLVLRENPDNLLKVIDNISDYQLSKQDKINNSEYDLPFELVEPTPIHEPIKNKVRSPVKPYWRPFALDDPIYLTNTFKKEGRPFTEDDYLKLFREHVSYKNFFSDEKRPFLKKIWNDAKYLNDLLEPLRELKIQYTLDLTGGSVRDFILNKHNKIKDLDFMLSIQDSLRGLKNLDTKGIFTKEQLNAVEWDALFNNEYYYTQSAKQDVQLRKIKLLELCLLRKNEKHQMYSHVKKREHVLGEDEYTKSSLTVTDRLLAVVKLDSNTNFPIDILLTDFSKPEFIHGFDFDLCKVSMCFVNPVVKKEFPTNYLHLISRFVADNGFWADVHNKTLTYNTESRSTIHIDSSFTNHLPRIMEKYPGSKVLITSDGPNREYAESSAKKYEADTLRKALEEKVPTQVEAKPKKTKL